MTREDELRSELQGLARLEAAGAGGAGADDFAQASEAGAEGSTPTHILLRQALKRLEDDPSLLSGDPDGVFTYEDPILAVAGRAYHLYHTQGDPGVSAGAAGVPGTDMRNRSLARWIQVFIHAWSTRHDPALIDLAGLTPTEAITVNRGVVRIAVVGDAGYRGYAQDNVLRIMREHHRTKPFDLVVHLGDTYFGGSVEEVIRHFLDPFAVFRQPQSRVATLCGNHDLYYGAAGFVHTINILGQPGRYFAIETPGWRILCLDTTLGAERLLRNEGCLDTGQLKWVETELGKDGEKGVVLMSHHFIVSAWNKSPSPTLAHQLGHFARQKVFAWYWGHEHSCVTYASDPHGFYGACVGNGAFLERHTAPVDAQPGLPSWFAGGRCACFGPRGPHFWPHGYLEIEVVPGRLVENYYLEDGETHVRVLDRKAGATECSSRGERFS
jgi:hypothetical protein